MKLFVNTLLLVTFYLNYIKYIWEKMLSNIGDAAKLFCRFYMHFIYILLFFVHFFSVSLLCFYFVGYHFKFEVDLGFL